MIETFNLFKNKIKDTQSSLFLPNLIYWIRFGKNNEYRILLIY